MKLGAKVSTQVKITYRSKIALKTLLNCPWSIEYSLIGFVCIIMFSKYVLLGKMCTEWYESVVYAVLQSLLIKYAYAKYCLFVF